MHLIRYIGEQFGNPTGAGGALSAWVMNRMNRRQYRAVVAALQVEEGDKVLDIGFGNGFLLRRLHRFDRCVLYGIDISADMLALAGKRNQNAVASGAMRLSRGDVVHLDFPNDFFDRAYTVNTVYFWSELDRGLQQIARVLRPGGIFVNAFYSKTFLDRLRYTDYGFAKYTPQALCRAAERCGLVVEELTEIRPGMSYCLILRKAMRECERAQ